MAVLLADYYRERGWDEKGRPTRQKLEELGLAGDRGRLLVMHVTLSFLGPFRDQLGVQSMEVELPVGSRYRELLDGIAAEMQAKLPDVGLGHALSVRSPSWSSFHGTCRSICATRPRFLPTVTS